MASPAEPDLSHRSKPIAHLLHSTTFTFLSLFSSPRTAPFSSQLPFRIFVPVTLADSPKPLRLTHSFMELSGSESVSPAESYQGVLSSTSSNSVFPSSVRIGKLNSSGHRGGPAFVGQVFSMCDLSGTGLMAVSTHFDIPFLSKRTPDWLKKMFASITKSERNGPIFRFFMDLGDAVSYVKRLNIPSGVVGACRLDLAYEHFKEKPHLFQFVPNEKQVKAANKLLRLIPQNGSNKKIDGVPVFSSQNLDIAISTTDGIKWYTPYFFDKNMLDNILEESVDQHFHALIQTRHMQRRRDVIDDNFATEVMDEISDSLLEPPELHVEILSMAISLLESINLDDSHVTKDNLRELAQVIQDLPYKYEDVQEVLEEMGNPSIPLSVISKAAEMQLLYTVDKVLLGNRWLRKVTGIQPKFPYLVDSFERRSAVSLLRASESTSCIANSKTEEHHQKPWGHGERGLPSSNAKDHDETNQFDELNRMRSWRDFFVPFWSKDKKSKNTSQKCDRQNIEPNPFLPKITMVGISVGEAGQMSKANLKKTMEDLTKDLEQTEHGSQGNDRSYDIENEERDPLFVANVGDYYSGLAKTGSTRWVRGGNK